MTVETYCLRAKLARRVPDPIQNGEDGKPKVYHHIFFVNARDMPRDIPMEANARRPNTRKQIYRHVKESLLDHGDGVEPGTFHLKNKGIVIVADSVSERPGGRNEFLIKLDRTRQGILDGGHTYQIIIDAQDSDDLPEEQYVIVQVRTGAPAGWIPVMAEGLNTSVQVQLMSLDNLAGKFGWLKDLAKGTNYANKIAWSENDAGDYDARDIIALMYLFNTKLFPDAASHPIAGYEKKSDALKAFDADDAAFRWMAPILSDILSFHDHVAGTARDLYNAGALKHGKRGRGAGLSFVRLRKFKPTFLDKPEHYDTSLEDAALYPILAAFRIYVERDERTGKARWSGGFAAVKGAWNELAYELMVGTLNTANEVGRAKNAIGKSRLHWDGVYKTVQNYRLQQRLSPPTADGKRHKTRDRDA